MRHCLEKFTKDMNSFMFYAQPTKPDPDEEKWSDDMESLFCWRATVLRFKHTASTSRTRILNQVCYTDP